MFQKKVARLLASILVSALLATSVIGYTSKAEDNVNSGEEIQILTEEGTQNDTQGIEENERNDIGMQDNDSAINQDSSEEVTDKPIEEEEI